MAQSEWKQLNSTLSKYIITKGKPGERPRFWSEVEYNVTILKEEEDEDDQFPSVLATKTKIGLGADEWSRLLELSLQLMDESEVSKFHAIIRSGERVAYKLHLVRIISNFPHVYQCSFQMILPVVQQIKDQGIALFKKKDILNSFFAFSQALKLLIPFEVRANKKCTNLDEPDQDKTDLKKEVKPLLSSLYNNLTACHLAQGNYQQALELSNEVLERSPADIKAIYRKGSALTGKTLIIAKSS